MLGKALVDRRLPAPPAIGVLTLAIFLSGIVGLYASHYSADVVTVWLANGIPLGAMLVRPRREWWLYLAGAAVGTFAAYAINGHDPLPSLGLAVCSAAEIAVAAVLLTASRAEDLLGSWRSVLLFLGFGVSASTALGSLGEVVVSGAFALPHLEAWHTRWMSDAIGMLTVTPVVVALLRHDQQDRPSPAAVAEFVLIAIGLLAATYIGFSSLLNHASIGYVALTAVLPCIVWAAARFGCGGAAFGNLLVAVTAGGAAIFAGPGNWSQGNALESLRIVQLALLAIVSTSLLFAVLFAERRGILARLNDAIESMSEGFILFDRDDAFVLCNEKYREMFNTSTDLLARGRSFEDIITKVPSVVSMPRPLAESRNGSPSPLRIIEVRGTGLFTRSAMVVGCRSASGGLMMAAMWVSAPMSRISN